MGQLTFTGIEGITITTGGQEWEATRGQRLLAQI